MTKSKAALANADLRKAMKEHGVPFWKLADAFGVCELTMQRRFRYELSDEEKAEIMAIIEKLD